MLLSIIVCAVLLLALGYLAVLCAGEIVIRLRNRLADSRQQHDSLRMQSVRTGSRIIAR